MYPRASPEDLIVLGDGGGPPVGNSEEEDFSRRIFEQPELGTWVAEEKLEV